MLMQIESFNVPPTPDMVAFVNDDVNGSYLRQCANTLHMLAS